jgi:diguanylate cyclase
MIAYTYNFWLVGISVLVSMMSAFTGLSLTRNLSAQPVGQRQVRIIMAAIALGGGIWSMHFVAMLAMRFGVPVFYEVIETVASALIAILLAGIALLILHFGRRTQAALMTSGTILGLGTVAMHYVGLSAIKGCIPVINPQGVLIAGVLAVGMGIAAIQIAYGKRTEGTMLLATLVFGASVAVVHFSAMRWTEFRQSEVLDLLVPMLANPQVAIVVLLTAFVISGAFLLTGASFMSRTWGSANVPGLPIAVVVQVPTAPVRELQRLPYEKDGKTYLVNFDKVSAIRAEGHYTTAFLDNSQVFCPWSITQAETEVPPGFVRVHRSWLVNLAHVTGFERAKDHGYCLFAGSGPLTRVPVSRARVNSVKEALGL